MGLDLISSTVVWIFIIGSLTFHFRERLAKVFKKIPLPAFLLFMLVGLLFAIAEENINCPPDGCSIVPLTIPIVFFPFLVLDLVIVSILKHLKQDSRIAMLSFGILGWLIEFVWGGFTALLWSSPVVTVIMTVWVILTYSIIVIVPVTILYSPKKTTSKRAR